MGERMMQSKLEEAGRHLKDQEQSVGLLEGKLQALELEAGSWREQVCTLQNKVNEAEGEKRKREQTQKELKEAIAKVKAQDRELKRMQSEKARDDRAKETGMADEDRPARERSSGCV